MADIQSSRMIMRGRWYCTNCGYGPHNSEIDVGCANCGHIPHRRGKFEEAMIDFATQSLPTHPMTSIAPTSTLLVAPLGPLNNSEFSPQPQPFNPSAEPLPANKSYYDTPETCDYDQVSAPPPKPMHDKPHLMSYR